MAGVAGRSGGFRIGAGRPSKNARGRWLDGGADKRAPKPLKAPETAIEIGELPPVPGNLTPAELSIWLTTAPLAHAALTLTAATVDDFHALCTLQTEMDAVLQERRAEGWTARGLALAREYRGLVARVEGKRRAFKLAPMGKEMVEIEAPKDEWAEFDGLKVVAGGKP
jgi:hypothetical protein